MNRDNETKQDAWEESDDLMLEYEPIKTLVPRRYELGSNPYANKNPRLWADTRMIINEIAEAICMQLCTRLIPPKEGDPGETLVVLDRKGKQFDLPVRECRVDPSPLLTGECAL